MAKNLVAKNGTAVHAPATEGIGTAERVTLCSNMRRAASYEIKVTRFAETDAAVTCKDCCRIQGIEAPKVAAKRAKPALDAFEVGQRFCYSDLFGAGTDRKCGEIVKLTKSWVTFVPEDAPATKSGKPYTMAIARDKARRLNG